MRVNLFKAELAREAYLRTLSRGPIFTALRAFVELGLLPASILREVEGLTKRQVVDYVNRDLWSFLKTNKRKENDHATFEEEDRLP